MNKVPTSARVRIKLLVFIFIFFLGFDSLLGLQLLDGLLGGELLVAEGTEDSLPIMGYRFENDSYSEALLARGEGRYVQPKPNRLVLLGGAPHAVAPVTPAAGQNIRASVSGFFLR